MKKMNVYEAPKAEVIEMNLNATVLTGSVIEDLGGNPLVPSNQK
jgi:hypothetical protein